MTGVPEINKSVDAWAPDGPRPALIYGDEFVTLPIAAVEIAIGGQVMRENVSETSEAATFVVRLDGGPAVLAASFLDAEEEWLTDAYYVYVRKI